MILSSETHSNVVFHRLKDNRWAAVLEQFPYPTPIFVIERLFTDEESLWRVNVKCEIGFTENMKQRSDVLEFIVQSQMFVDTTSISSVRETVTRLLNHWAKLFPRGVPDVVF